MSENITDSNISPIFYHVLGILAVIILNIFNIIHLSSNINIQSWTTNFILILLISVPVIYRIINTLDAMVGYFPAKLDDILNFIPARISGFHVIFASYILSKSDFNWKNSYQIMSRDSNNSPSHNFGFTMAPIAGSLNISLEKKGVYKIGYNDRFLKRNDIIKAVKLSKLSIYLFILVSFIILFLYFFI
ncbi:Cobalamin biosynthesis protein CbiB [Candidatus Methanobinarius endosymbioticus]|uniref:Probable cobalamin biosynthesis protein CobD n=1 Tax=Candidatus Methanobinarius endosymbioticus TaxID=2006182 RepID=A0A366M8R2_9EURY|nr:Cobalamin biosynthesis protein CbiB [Candidatus Methanobinarius endosymbioticus]